jgi:hypothetical protein
VPLLGDGAMLALGDRFSQYLALTQVLAQCNANAGGLLDSGCLALHV